MFSAELLFKSLFLLWESPSFAGKRQTRMKTDEFYFLCSAICSGGYDGMEVSADMDNMFYEHFGMSSGDVRAMMKLLGVKSL